MEIYARQQILGQGDDHEELICSQVSTMNRNDLRSANSGKQSKLFQSFLLPSFVFLVILSESLNMLLYDCAAFCCSFQAKATSKDGVNAVGALASTFS